MIFDCISASERPHQADNRSRYVAEWASRALKNVEGGRIVTVKEGIRRATGNLYPR